MSNTHDQIYYNNNTSGGYIQEYPIQICSISDKSRHGVKYICIWKYSNTFLSICIWRLGIKSICI